MGGDGLVNIGRIDASGRDLGKVKVKGDVLETLLLGDSSPRRTSAPSHR